MVGGFNSRWGQPFLGMMALLIDHNSNFLAAFGWDITTYHQPDDREVLKIVISTFRFN